MKTRGLPIEARKREKSLGKPPHERRKKKNGKQTSLEGTWKLDLICNCVFELRIGTLKVVPWPGKAAYFLFIILVSHLSLTPVKERGATAFNLTLFNWERYAADIS